MKKTFRFLALSFALICGSLTSWASVKPAVGTFVGQTVSGGVVKYQVIDDGLPEIAYKATNAAGDEVDVKAYPVEISGLDYDGLTAKNLTKLNIATSFTEKYGDELNGYYVARIIDTQGTTDPVDGLGRLYKKAFYAMTDLTELTFGADANGLGEDKFTFSVGDYSFYGCTSLQKLTFPDNVNKIGSYAFQGTIITEFVIPAKCAELGACAFNDTKKLGTVTVSESGNAVLTKIDKQVFANSFVSILDLSKATALQSIDDQAFIFNVSDVNAQLKQVILPDVDHATNPFISLGTNGTCFANCMALESVDNLAKTNVTAINPGAFQNCVKLAKLDFPATATICTDLVTSPFLNTPLLKKITFADGWNGTIEDGVYISTDGKKIKYDSATKKYTLVDYTLTAADKKKELSYLEEIEFMGAVYGDIDDAAFGNTVADAACTGLKTVKFDGKIYEGVTIGVSAFENCVNLATLTFNGFEIADGNTGAILINQNAFKATAIAAVDFKGFSFYGNATPSNIKIEKGAFACDNLASVEFGDITFYEWVTGGTPQAGAANEFVLIDEAFVSDKLTKVHFGDIINDNTNKKSDGLGKLTIGQGTKPVFEANKEATRGVLEEVTFGKLVTGAYTIANDAFRSELLKKVEFKDVTTVLDKDGSLAIGDRAFGYNTVPEANRKANEKTVKFANIVETFTAPKANVLTVTMGDHAFYGDLLKTVTIGELGADKLTIGNTGSGDADAPFGGNFAEKTVTIGDITSKDWTIKGYSFSGDKLASVTIGDIINAAPTTASIATYAFANTNQDTDDFEAMDETVTIGQLANAQLNIAASAFQGPKKEESTFTVTIKGAADASGNEPGITVNPTIALGAFAGPAIGTTSYTLGDIDVETAGIASKAFQGSKTRISETETKNNTDVTIGNYNKKFTKANTFTNCDDVVAKSWNTTQNITTFDLPRTLTIEKNVTATLAGGGTYSNNLEELTIGGDVISPAKIKDFGTGVRKIAFTSEDPKVYAGAIQTAAFEPASDDALLKGETMSVIYRVKTAKNSNAIFDKKAFNSVDDGEKNVILYTDQWSLEHTFQNVEIGGDAEQVYRIKLNASPVAPGEDIAAECVTGANGAYAYGRLYVPAGAGMRYKVNSNYDENTRKNGVNLFSASISGQDIYMNTVTVMEGYYWIDATESAQTFVVRTSEVGAAAGDKVTVVAESVSEKEATDNDAEGTVILATDWFDAASATKNALKYATSDITAAEFQNDALSYNKGIYQMLNPKTRNLAFGLYDQTNSSTKDMKQGSIYVVSRSNKYARLNVIWPEDIDEENGATAIQKVENATENNGAIYNLQGVRVNNAQKGIYIQNGKKFVK